MELIDLDKIYLDFIEKFKIARQFMHENFGEKDILLRKNQGLIKARDMEIKNSPIKSYVFHGYGCDFGMKNSTIDLEIINDQIGFTDWSFFTFCKKICADVSQVETTRYLKQKVESGDLRLNGKIFDTI